MADVKTPKRGAVKELSKHTSELIADAKLAVGEACAQSLPHAHRTREKSKAICPDCKRIVATTLKSVYCCDECNKAVAMPQESFGLASKESLPMPSANVDCEVKMIHERSSQDFERVVNELLKQGGWRIEQTEVSVTDSQYDAVTVRSGAPSLKAESLPHTSPIGLELGIELRRALYTAKSYVLWRPGDEHDRPPNALTLGYLNAAIEAIDSPESLSHTSPDDDVLGKIKKLSDAIYIAALDVKKNYECGDKVDAIMAAICDAAIRIEEHCKVTLTVSDESGKEAESQKKVTCPMFDEMADDATIISNMQFRIAEKEERIRELEKTIREYEHETETIQEVKAENTRLRAALEKAKEQRNRAINDYKYHSSPATSEEIDEMKAADDAELKAALEGK